MPRRIKHNASGLPLRNLIDVITIVRVYEGVIIYGLQGMQGYTGLSVKEFNLSYRFGKPCIPIMVT